MSLRILRRLLSCIPIAAVLLGGIAIAHTDERGAAIPTRPLRILPLGDSITAGIVDGGKPGHGGYRPALERLLAEHDLKAVLVGTKNDLVPGDPDRWHDGYPGYVIRETSPGAPGQLYGEIARNAIEQTEPDVILLMIGTNDFLRYEATHGSYSVDRMVESMDLLLDEIFTVDPHVRVIVGAMLNSPKVDACYVQRFNTGRSACDAEVHPSIASVVAKYAQRGFAVSYAADLANAIPRDLVHFPDGIHPADGPGGYDALAEGWFQALESLDAAPLASAVSKTAEQPASHRR